MDTEKESKDTGEQWLPVLDYAVNSRVSISTLRRRIKSNSLEHRLINGRYLIRTDLQAFGGQSVSSVESTESVAMIQSLVSELKKAYGMLLTEKEEMIQQLRSEIDTLKHINQFLEFQILNADSNENRNQNPDLNF